jgi:hypothetical protein
MYWGGGERIAGAFFVRNPEERITLGRLWRRLEDNIKITVKDTGYEGVDGIHLAQVRYKWWGDVNTVMNPRVPQNAGQLFTC